MCEMDDVVVFFFFSGFSFSVTVSSRRQSCELLVQVTAWEQKALFKVVGEGRNKASFYDKLEA